MKKENKYKKKIVISSTFTDLVKMSVEDNPAPKPKKKEVATKEKKSPKID